LGLLFLAAGALGLLGCAHLWQPPRPTVIFGPPVIEGDRGKIVVSVSNIPQDGLGAIAVEFGGLTYPADKMEGFSLEGLNGFEVLAWEFAGGQGGFVAASTAGLESGSVVAISFKAKEKVDASEIVIDKAKVSLASARNTLIEDFEVSMPSYYAR
jgi:hypothetical protein